MIVKYTEPVNPVKEQFMVLQKSMFNQYEVSINFEVMECLEKCKRTPILDTKTNAFHIFVQGAHEKYYAHDFDSFKNAVDVEFADLMYFVWKGKY